jgi:23S rRNA pseudouridine1911/1915/1917 synthase
MNRGWSYREQVGPEHSGRTVLSYLAATRRHSTESDWAARIERGEIEIEGLRAHSEAVLRRGQTVVWHRPPWTEDAVPLTFDVIHQDESIIVVNKPSGLPTMPAGGFLDHTLLALVRAQYPGASPLHRLGRYTSGLVVFGRTKAAASQLSRAWRDREVKKTYRALCQGRSRSGTIEIDAPIGPVPHPRLGTVQAASASGKPAHSVATVIELHGDRTLFRVEIMTGRPHQIRIHMGYAGHPLVGDPMYAVGGGLLPNPGLPGDGGYALHASQLEFMHPATGLPFSIATD